MLSFSAIYGKSGQVTQVAMPDTSHTARRKISDQFAKYISILHSLISVGDISFLFPKFPFKVTVPDFGD